MPPTGKNAGIVKVNPNGISPLQLMKCTISLDGSCAGYYQSPLPHSQEIRAIN